jgi:ribose/xylose/arabinose/galactoside ABC-type transport system permease subunit
MKKLNQIICAALIVLLMIIFSIGGKHFLTVSNLMSVTTTMAEFGIMAYGMMLAIMVSGINLTMGSVCGLTSLIIISLYKLGLPIGIAVMIALLASLGMGLITGLFISRLKVAPMLMTLSLSMLYTGISYVISQGNAISGFPIGYWFLGQENILGVPAQTWLLIVITVVLTLVLKCTSWGVKIYAVGNNPAATVYSGVNAAATITSAYVVSSLLAAISGVIMSSRVATARLDLGASYETKCIAAVVLGGASMAGGSGSPVGTLLGVTIFSLLSNGLNHIGVSPYIQQFILGALLISVLVLNENILPVLLSSAQKRQDLKVTTH